MKKEDKERVVDLIDKIDGRLEKFLNEGGEVLIVKAREDLTVVGVLLYDFLMSE